MKNSNNLSIIKYLIVAVVAVCITGAWAQTSAAGADAEFRITKAFADSVRQYQFVDEFKDGYALVMKNYQFGLINKKGEAVIPFEYEDAFGFTDGYASVKKEGLWGTIDKSNRVIVPFNYYLVGYYPDGLFHVVLEIDKENSPWGCADKFGNSTFTEEELEKARRFAAGQ